MKVVGSDLDYGMAGFTAGQGGRAGGARSF